MSDTESADEWGLLMEGPTVQTFSTRHAALHFQKESAAFWGVKAPLLFRSGDSWLPVPDSAN